jgi:hypothetical protein
MSRADYLRRQADTCLRLSLITSSKDAANELLVLAQEYYTKADAIVAEQNRYPRKAMSRP